MRVALLDIGGTYTKYGLSQDGKTLESVGERVSMERKENIRVFTPDYLFEICDELAPFDGISLSAAGMLNKTRSFVRNRSSEVQGYAKLPLRELLAARYNTKVIMHNDVDCAAIAEGQLGAAIGKSDYICITYGTGVGAGLVLNGELYCGEGGSAGEIGHMVIHGGGLPCSCGNKGCYERYASVTALVKQVQKITGDVLDGRKIFEWLYAGDTVIEQILLNWVDEIVHGLVTLVRVFDIKTIILGGGIMNEDWLIDRIRECMPRNLHSCYRDLQVLKAKMGNHAGLLGALILFNQTMSR